MSAAMDLVGERRGQMLHTAFGPQVLAALQDSQVLEVMVNPDGALWVDRAGVGRVACGARLEASQVERIIRLVASQAQGAQVAAACIVSAELPLRGQEGGERFEGVLPPVSTGPCFAIRKPTAAPVHLEDYVARAILTRQQADLLIASVAARKNILVAGATSSGKTTLANALLAQIALLGERVLILEDTRELRCEALDCLALRSQPGLADMRALIRSTLRLRPDRIVIGEVRGGEALDLLKAWNTGHPGGVATIHANSALAALHRLESLVQEVAAAPVRHLIVQAIDLVVFLEGRDSGRKVGAIARVQGVSPDGQFVISQLADAPPNVQGDDR